MVCSQKEIAHLRTIDLFVGCDVIHYGSADSSVFYQNFNSRYDWANLISGHYKPYMPRALCFLDYWQLTLMLPMSTMSASKAPNITVP